MAYNIGASGTLHLGWDELDVLVQKVMEDKIHKCYTTFGRQSRLWGGVLPMNTTPYQERGIVKTYKKLPGAGGVNLGQINPDTALPSPEALPTYTSLWVNKNHIHDTEFSLEVGRRFQRMVKMAKDGWGNEMAALEAEVMDQQMYLWDLLMLLDRHAKIGTVINNVGSSGETTTEATFLGAPTTYYYKDTTNKLIIFDIQCSWDTVRLGIAKGRLLQVCAAPGAITTPITTVRNYTKWIRVISDPTPSTAGTYCYQIRCAVPYTDANYTSLATQVAAIAATDVIVPWASSTTSSTDLPTGGPNYGFPGFRFWVDTNGSGVFADIEDVGGSVSSALLTDEDTQASVNRNAVSQEHDFLNPIIVEGAGAAVSSTTFTQIDTLIEKLAMKHSGELSVGIVANSLINKMLISTLGTTGLTQNFNAGDAATRFVGRYGVASWAYDSLFSNRPVTVMTNDDLAPDMVMVVVVGDGEDDPGPLFEMISPEPANWEVPPSAALRAVNASGRPTHKLVATRAASGTPFPRARLDNSLGVLRNIKPA